MSQLARGATGSAKGSTSALAETDPAAIEGRRPSTTPPSRKTVEMTSPRKSKKALLTSALAVVAATSALVACGATDPQAIDQPLVSPAANVGAAAAAPQYVTYSSTNVAQSVAVPTGVTSVTITALGGAGGQGISDGSTGAGALAIGTLSVTPGQQLLVSVGAKGGNATYTDDDAQGGWGGMGASGGTGNAQSDTLRNSGAGGGATSVQLADGTPIIVAGGGGGAGNNTPASGGNAGSSLTGGDGGEGGGYPTGPYGGKGHGGANSVPNGENGHSGSGLGGSGGGGGGGVNGGTAGGGAGVADGGGGGGAGSSMLSAQLTSTSIEAYTSNAGRVTIASPSGGAAASSPLPSGSNGEVELVWNAAS